ncbi:MAG: AI-2E family transporter [Nostoc sp. LLA-1]|nr:AI-2E family transporter [Cyanocohniella sp. LLY]
MNQQSTQKYVKLLLLTVGIIGFFFSLLLLSWKIADVLLLLFLGVLLAIVLRTLAKLFSRYTPLSTRWSVIVVIVLAIFVLGIGGRLIVPEIANQTNELVEQLNQASQRIEDILSQYNWGEDFIEQVLPQDGPQLPETNTLQHFRL